MGKRGGNRLSKVIEELKYKCGIAIEIVVCRIRLFIILGDR